MPTIGKKLVEKLYVQFVSFVIYYSRYALPNDIEKRVRSFKNFTKITIY